MIEALPIRSKVISTLQPQPSAATRSISNYSLINPYLSNDVTTPFTTFKSYDDTATQPLEPYSVTAALLTAFEPYDVTAPHSRTVNSYYFNCCAVQ